MPTPQVELTLSEYIAQFKADGDLAHIFVQGSAQQEVVTENGTYPTIAKMVADNQAALQTAISDVGFANRTYAFSNALTVHVKHNMRSTKFTTSIFSAAGQLMYAEVEPVDDSEFVMKFTEIESGSVTVVFCTNT